jgi:tRNA nucleotidyltransferase (CCA-adding enzyme)
MKDPLTGEIFDPFDGVKDLKDGILKVVDTKLFADDPLRMLRAVQFASRFDFTIEPKTMKLIKDNAPKIKEIAGERMFIELEKIVTKGDKRVGAQLLKDTGLYENMFGVELDQSIIDESSFDRVKTMGEFIYLLTRQLDNPAEVFRTTLKGDIPTVKEIEALTNGFTNGSANNVKNRVVAHNMFMKSPESLKSEILPNKLKKAIVDLDSGLYPKSIKELMVNGNDLMEMGLKGKEIGDALNSALINVYGDKIKNNREELLNFLNK